MLLHHYRGNHPMASDYVDVSVWLVFTFLVIYYGVYNLLYRSLNFCCCYTTIAEILLWHSTMPMYLHVHIKWRRTDLILDLLLMGALRQMERLFSRFIACGSASLEGVIWVIGDEFLR